MNKNKGRKITFELYPIDKVKVLPPPDPEKVKANLESYKSIMGEFDFNETMKRIMGIPTLPFYPIDK